MVLIKCWKIAEDCGYLCMHTCVFYALFPTFKLLKMLSSLHISQTDALKRLEGISINEPPITKTKKKTKKKNINVTVNIMKKNDLATRRQQPNLKVDYDKFYSLNQFFRILNNQSTNPRYAWKTSVGSSLRK